MIEFVIILILTVFNGLCAMAEIAMVSVRKARMKKLLQGGDARAAIVLQLIESPNRFLSTVQVGITLVTIGTGVFGGATISNDIATILIGWGVPESYADPSSYGVVVCILTFISIILGELVPKRLALNHPEAIALFMAKPMDAISVGAAPLVNLLSGTTDKILNLLGIKAKEEQPVSEEEVRLLIDQGLHAGVFFKQEKEMVERVLVLDLLKVSDLMNPAPKIVWLDLQEKDDENWRRIVASGHSHFPVCKGTRDNLVGMVSVKALWANQSLVGNAKIQDVLTEPVMVPMVMPALKLLETFKKSGKHVAIATDEFGAFEGLVTLNDVLEAIVGEIPSKDQPHRQEARKRADGSWIFEALIHIKDFKKSLGIIDPLPHEEEEAYTTLSGFILNYLGHIPTEGEKFRWDRYQFEIIDMDSHKIDKVLVIYGKKTP
jgi:putative hemolysin